jgi:cardiolipin synthase
MIDDQVLFIGSMNVSECHLKSKLGAKAWRDTSLKTTGENLSDLKNAFEIAWNFSMDYFDGFRRKIRLFVPTLRVRLNHSRVQGQYYRQQLVEAIRQARDRIWITNPYFVPDAALLKALMLAARRGIDVKFLFPSTTDFKPVQYAAWSYYQRLLKSGAKIYEYQPSILHAKVMIIDQLATIGSSNLNHRSIFQDLEADIILHSLEGIETLSQQFSRDLIHSHAITLEHWRRRSWVQRFLERLFLIFRKVL